MFFKKKAKEETRSKVEILQQQSANAVGSIRNLIATLKATNEEADVVQTDNAERIKAIENENKLLEAMKVSNAKIAENFEALLA